MLRRVAIALVLWAGVWALAPDAVAQNAGGSGDRIALVIGNDRYPNLPSDKQLSKAVNDARAIGDALRKLGYRVISGENLTRQEMVDKLFAFTREIKPGDTAALFFAGHGVAIAGGNYLLPTDVRPAATGEEARVRNMALGEADIIADIQERKARVAVLFIDACRDNPFRQPGVLRSTGSERGLVRSGEAEGVFAIYSAGYGQSALDALGPNDTSPNSVFTRVLAPALARSDAHLGDIIIDVREQVSKLARSIGHQQLPAYYDQTLGGRVYLAGLSKPDKPVPPDVADAASKVNEAVVTLVSSQTAEEAAKNPDGKPKRTNGSGFVLDPSGLILTADYLVNLANVEVGFADKSRRHATVVAVDKASGVALLKATPGKPLKALKFGDSDALRVGSRVFAIGNRGNLGNAVTAGLVSGLDREGFKDYKQKHIETDIAFKGMGGGPLLNLDGEVVGMNFSMSQSEASGYALPSKVAAAVFDQLRSSEPPRPWLGVRVARMTDDIAENLALKPARGALVSSVDDRGPAKPAGFASSDVILRFDGKDIKEMPDLPRAVAQSQIGKAVSIVVWRDGKEEKLTARLGQIRLTEDAKARPAQTGTPSEKAAVQVFMDVFKLSDVKKAIGVITSLRQEFGFRVTNLDDDFRSKHKVDADVYGLAITAVDAGSPAAEKQVKPGEVIVDVQQEHMWTVIDFQERVERLKKEGRKTMLLLLAGAEGSTRFVVMPLR